MNNKLLITLEDQGNPKRGKGNRDSAKNHKQNTVDLGGGGQRAKSGYYRKGQKEFILVRPGGMVASSLSIHRVSRCNRALSLSPPLGSRGSTSNTRNLTAQGLYLWYRPIVVSLPLVEQYKWSPYPLS